MIGCRVRFLTVAALISGVSVFAVDSPSIAGDGPEIQDTAIPAAC